MPCYSPMSDMQHHNCGVSNYDHNKLQDKLTKTEAMLCTVMHAIEASNESDTVECFADWERGGITRTELADWWSAHRGEDDGINPDALEEVTIEIKRPQPDFRDPKQLMVEVDTLRTQFAELMLHPDRPHPTKIVLWAFLKTMLRDMVMEAPQNLWIQLCSDFAQETYEAVERKVVQLEAPRGIIIP